MDMLRLHINISTEEVRTG